MINELLTCIVTTFKTLLDIIATLEIVSEIHD